MLWKKILKIAGIVLMIAGFLIGVLVVFLTLWSLQLFGNVSMEEILFHLRMPLNGTDPNTIIGAIVWVVLPSLLLTAGFLFLFLSIIRQRRRSHPLKHTEAGAVRDQKKPEPDNISEPQAEKQIHAPAAKNKNRRTLFGLLLRIPVWAFPIISILFLTGGGVLANRKFHITTYLQAQAKPSTLIEEEYADPKTTAIQFPEQKRNLIYIFLESMETSYSSAKNGGAFSEDLIPELTEIAAKNINFSNTSGFGGALQLTGSSWTIAGMFAQTAGLPLNLPVNGNAMDKYAGFFPGVTSLGDILKAQGYKNYLMIGSDAVFGGRKNYFSQHGSYHIFDYNTAKEIGKIPDDYYQFWGYEDRKLFAYAKEKLTEISKTGEPFNLTLLTVDTHFPNGYACPLCRKEHDTAYKNALSCSSRQVSEFITWVMKQEFYQNTTIVLAGDHQTMATETVVEMPKEYNRYIYNAFLNSAVLPQREKERIFSTMDLFPTTLAALGAEIDGNRLGLGTNLFSDRQTLPEEKGLEYVNSELKKKSSFYDDKLLYETDSTDEKQETGIRAYR